MSQTTVKKPNLLYTLSDTAGPCRDCRHVNQGTADYAEGHLFCGIGGGAKGVESECTVKRPSYRGHSNEMEMFFAYETFDGDNGTYGILHNSRLLAPNATEHMRRLTRADDPVL